jgi:hypothetical protein
MEGDLSFHKYANQPGIYLCNPERQIYQNTYPPGVALIRFPVMVWLVNLTPGAPLIGPGEHWASLVISALVLVAVCILCLATCHLLGVDSASSHISLLATVFGTGLFHYASYDGFMSHIYSALGVALLVFVGVRAIVLKRGALPFVPIILITFLMILVRNTNLLLLIGLLLAYLAARKRVGILKPRPALHDLAGWCAGIGAATIIQLAYNYHANGHITWSSYGGQEFLWHRPEQLSVLFSYERGLFSYYPLIALILALGWLIRRTRLAAAYWSALLLAYTMLYGFWWSWMLGGGFGHRGFIELMPIGTVVFAVSLSEMPVGWRRAATLVASVCAVLTLQFMVGYWRGSLPFEGTTAACYWMHVWGRKSIWWFLAR